MMSEMKATLVILQNIFTILIVIPLTILTSILVSIWRLIAYKWSESNLSQKHVIITGCGSGFGQILALRLAQLGLKVHAGCRRQESVQDLERTRDRENLGANLFPFLVDITSQADVDRAFDVIKHRIPESEGLWALVNNAGSNEHTAPDHWLTVEQYRDLLEINCLGHIRMTHKFKSLITRSHGRLIFVGSIFCDILSCNLGPYGVSKFALNGYAKLLNLELSRKAKVITVVPGLSPTSLSGIGVARTSNQKAWNRLPEHIRSAYPPDFLERRLEFVKKSIDTFNVGNDLDLTVNAMVHAVTARFPKSRYWLGYDGLMARLLSNCNEDVARWLSDLARQINGDVFDNFIGFGS